LSLLFAGISRTTTRKR